MKINVWLILGILISFLIIIDLYFYKGIRILLKKKRTEVKKIISFSYWAVSIFYYAIIIYFFIFHRWHRSVAEMSDIYYITGTFFLIYIPKIVFIIFHFIDDLIYLIRRLILLLKRLKTKKTQQSEEISRRAFLTRAGIIIASVPFASTLYGIVKGRFNFRVISQKLYFPDLPESFNGIKIVQISDIHMGSFYGYKNEVAEGIDLVNVQNPDYIFFTGDLVNNFTDELDGWFPLLIKLKAKQAKYSILGNHDYGDYYKWKTPEEKMLDHQNLINYHQTIGFQLLRNEHVRLENNNKSIVLAGVENWGLHPFRQDGDIDKATEGLIDSDFIILLSHDPTHWDAKVLGRKNIRLTLSGHTHGMQMGIKLVGKEWSPASFRYLRWAGLYNVEGQYLYVNRGFGFIGIPARIGMPPEITVIELYKR
jgi:hypothetical protein